MSWLPTFTQAGKYPVTFTVNDNNGLFDTMVVIISVNNVVQKPVLSKMGNQKIAENQLLEFHVSASQTEPGQPIFSASEIPLGAVFVNQIFSWTPTYTQAGSYPLKLIYTDGGGGVASESLVITVENVNRLPVLTVPESLELSEAESVTFAVTAIDLDGDPLVYSAVGLPIGASFVNQVFSWTPSYNQAGNYALTFSVKDGQGGQTLQQVAMVVRDINRPPVFVKMANQIVSENQLLTFTLNGQDPDNDVLSYGVSSLPKGAIVNNQRVSWLPTFTQAGKYPVTFTVNDNNGLSDTMVVIISVNNVVQKPVLTKIGSQKIAENQLLEFHVSANQTEPGQPVFSASEIPLGAVFDNQIFLWTPTYTQAGSYPLKLIYTDGRGVVASESLVITVENVNRPPVLTVPESLELSEAQFVTFAVTAIDLDGDPLAFNVAGLPAGALFVNQVFSWTPSYNQAGDFAIIFSVFDKTTTVSSVTSIHVENVNRLPVITLLADQIISENQGVSIKVAAMDPDGDALTYTLSGLPYGASFLNRTLTWTPTYVQSGVYPLVFSVQDTSGGIATKLMTITVNNVYQSPVLTGVANHIVFENQLVNFKVIALQTEAVPLVYSISGLPNGAVFDNQQFSWTPSYTQAGRYSITINVLDGLSGNDAKSMIITVNDFNRLPVFLPLSDVVVSENQLVSFCFNATDPDGDTLNFSMSPIPSGATFTNQTFTWTPNYLQSGIYTLALSVTDGKGGVGKAAMTIQVNNVNRLPLMGLCQSIIATENDTIAVRFSATDPDGDALTYVVDSLPAGALFFNQLLTWKPSYTQAGIYPITLFVTDVLGGTTQTSVIITVNNKYQLPVLASIPNQVVNENSPIIFSLSAFQTEGLPLTFSMENLPAGAIFVKQVFSWTPSYNQSGRYLLSAVVSDGLGGEDRKIIIVTVNNVNRSPAFLDMSDKSSSENQLITFSVTAVDPDGDILTYSVTGLPIGATFKNNMISWTPSLTQSGYYSLTFTVVDTLGLSDKKIIGIMIQNINRPPVIAPIENPTISENQMLSLTLSATDPDNEYLTYSIIGRPMGAVFSNQTFTWIPAYTQAGVYPVTFSVSDRSGGVAQLPVIITVKNVYVAPLLTKIADKTVNEGQQLMFYVQASGTEVSTLIYEISQIPQGAEFNNQVFTWTPTYTQSGVYMLAIKVTDLYGGSDSQTLCVTVNRVNRPPIISVPINPVTIENQVISFNVTAVDPDGTSVILSVAGLPDGAVFANNILTWTPTFFQSGRYLLTFKAIDREGGISSANLIIVVENVNRHPVLQPIPDKVVSENQQLTILLDATDLDNDTLKFMLIKAPPGALLSQQVLTWLPNYSMAGVYLVTIAVDDGVGGTDVKSCVITVNHVNRLPVIDYIPNKIVAENQPVAIVVSATDADNDALIYSSDNLPEGAIFSGQVFTWVPTSKQSGKYNLNFIVTDSNGGVAQRQVIIVVNNVNRPPVLPPIRFKLLRGTEPFSFLIYAFDPDDDVLTFSMTGNPSGATINNGVFQWTPGLDQVGIYRIKLIVSDALGGIAKRYMYLIVFNDLQDLNGFVTALSPVPTSDLTPGSEFYTQRIMPDASFMSLIGLPAGVFPVAMTLKQLMMNAEGLADYSPYISNTIESGKGAWLMSTQDIMVFYGSDDVTTMDKIVSLAAGWNLISNPMVTSLNWLSVRVNVNGKFYTMTQAINQGFVQNGIHTYSNAADVFQNDLLLQPWHGYFVYINQPLNIIFPAQSSTVKLEPENVAASNLSILVKLNNGTWTRSVRLLAGTVLSSAEDILSPPWAPSQNFDVWVQNGSRSLKSCRVNQNSDVLEWTITVRSRCSQRLSLQFSQEFSQSDKIYSYYVLDQNQRRNMGVANLFFDVVTGDTTYKIQGVSAAAASGISSVINYPNPFNPAFGETVKLNYTLSDIMSGTVKIYSIHGKLIRTISVEGANATSGVHTGISMWDGRDESSIIVPSELYVYVMNLSTSDGTHFKKSGKILLWKQ